MKKCSEDIHRETFNQMSLFKKLLVVICFRSDSHLNIVPLWELQKCKKSMGCKKHETYTYKKFGRKINTKKQDQNMKIYGSVFTEHSI